MLRTTTFTVAMMALAGVLAANVEHEESTPVLKAIQASVNAGPPIHVRLPEGGVAGWAEIGGSSAAAGDRSHILDAISDYSRRHGPFSTPGTRGVFEPFSIFPVGGREWEDLIMFDYVDLSSDDGTLEHWNCGGRYTYDGSYANSAWLKSFDQQLIGVPVIAVLDGTVTEFRDSEPDQNEVPGDGLTNYIGIHHGGDRYCWYESLKQGSVTVEVGDEVLAGQQIAQVASSGGASWPGLRFSTWEPTGNVDEWIHVEPYAGDCNPGSSGWQNQIDIPVGAECRDFGITTSNLSDFYADEIYSWRPPLEGSITLNHDRLWMWTYATDIGIFSTYQLRFYDPVGNLNYDTGTQWLNFSSTSYRQFITWFAWDIPGLHTIPGTWTVDVIVNGDPYINFPLEVLQPGTILPNRPPKPIATSISPPDATPDDFLTCRVYTLDVDDPDWDLLSFEYTWTVGGRVVRQVTSAGLADHLPRLEGCDGAVVTCQVVPSDGSLNGPTSFDVVRLSGFSSGDLNCDGSIGIEDLLVILNEWGACDICSGDLDQNAVVDITDLLAVIAEWEG